MKKLLLFITLITLLSISGLFSQGMMDYVDEVRGDTLVIKDFFDMGSADNSLYQVITADTTDVPDGRVYMLKASGWYPNRNNPSTRRPTVVVGDLKGSIVQYDGEEALPLLSGYNWGDGSNTGSFNFRHNTVIKHVNVVPAHQSGLGWSFFGSGNSKISLTWENCLFERTRWVFTNAGNDSISWYMRDCYFVNMVGQECRRNGGVLDVFARQDTLWVENCTHVIAQGLVYKLRANPFNRVMFNHNTFVNMSNLWLLDLGSQSNISVTNNIFVNCNVQPYGPVNLDVGEEDIDKLPIGIVNVRVDTSVHKDRKYLVDNNVIYWDESLADLPDILNTNEINGSTDWVSQMITMNTRTKGMFENDAEYPYLVEGLWIEEMPTFTGPQDLFTDQLVELKDFSEATCDTNSVDIYPLWRLIYDEEGQELYTDFPIPVDLSYTNAGLLTGALDFPFGDLNWFPTQKAVWEAQKDAEYALIENALATGTTITSIAVKNGPKPESFKLEQNYPNPFNPSTVINFSIPKAGNVTLKVYNTLGQEVATLINGYTAAKAYNVNFNGAGLASGVYIYSLKYNNQVVTKKMMLVK
ncbi:MAG: T9SS type A sorting domain-containing protein [Calditrichaceae bacterium]|nr:T9SS type A sorting domain-containing protein [Calditrichaceae bacterium]MBN2708972.1 T9SS type A sorting domain-containing protein [Calditrichaceae bacterium]RQV97506.1 MAG: T9SS C-terminal target domain-containing protein [Calditrichota bacterium]